MARTIENRREILRRFMQDNKLTPTEWAKRSGVAVNSIYNFINGHSNGLDLRTYAKLARTAGVPVWKLSGDAPEPPSPTSLWVVGHVQAGLFREAVEWDQSQWYAIDVPVPDRFRRVAKALEVRGPSMNLEYPEGSIVVWIDVLDVRPPRAGDHVIAYSFNRAGDVEATVKELRIDGERSWLWPRSSDPAHQVPIDLDNPSGDVERVEIRGLVLGGYRPRIL